MKRIKRIAAAALLTAGLVVPFASGKASALSNCSSMIIYNTGYARCTSGTTGHVRVWVDCRVPGSTQIYGLYGPIVGINVWSTKECPWPMVVVNAGYQRMA